MSFKLLIISTLYAPYLNEFYRLNSHVAGEPFSEQYNHILADTSEPIGSYSIEYNRLGIETHCIIENAIPLQRRWAEENGASGVVGRDLVLMQVAHYKPDVVLVENVGYVDVEWLELLRCKVPKIRLIAISHCAPYNSHIIETMRAADVVLTCTPGLNNVFNSFGVRSFLIYHAFNPDVLNKTTPALEYDNDLVFSGSLYLGGIGGAHAERVRLIEYLFKQGIEPKIYGNLEKSSKIRAKQAAYIAIKTLRGVGLGGYVKSMPFIGRHEEYGDSPINCYSKELMAAVNPPVFGRAMYGLLQKSRIVLNTHGGVAGEYAGNIRLFEVTGVGSCLLTDNKRNMPELFDVANEVVVYDGFDDCAEKIRWLLDNEDERLRIARNGQRRTLRDHNVKKRCLQLVDIISSELNR